MGRRERRKNRRERRKGRRERSGATEGGRHVKEAADLCKAVSSEYIGQVTALADFLEHRSRPSGMLRYHELQGFLFAIACAPEMVRPSEWIPEVFGGSQAGFQTIEEAQKILPELMSLYNVVNASARSEQADLPPDCSFRENIFANFEDDAPVSLWSRGFLRGHTWLKEDWDAWVPDALDELFGTMLMTLSFFASRTLADAYLKEIGRHDLETTATVFRSAFPTVLAEYARLSRSIQQVLRENAPQSEPQVTTRIGRNDPCPCGSGRKYKKCHGAA